MLLSGPWISVTARLLLCNLCFIALAASAAAQDRSINEQESGAAQDFEDIMVHVPSMAVAGRILREVGIAKAQEGIPQGDGEPKFDTQNNKLYFRTSRANAATMKKILARIEKGGAATSRPAELNSAALTTPSTPTPVYAIEFWLVQLQLPKGESIELSGPRGEVLTILGGLEKESKAEILNHVYLTAEEGKSAQSMLNESVPVITSMASGGFGGGPARPESDSPGGGRGGSRPMMSSVARESLGTQFKVTANAAGNGKVMLDYIVSKSFLGKHEEGTLIPTDAAGGGVRQPSTRLFEIESALRAQVGSVVTASSQLRGGEKPSEIRVLVLVNPL